MKLKHYRVDAAMEIAEEYLSNDKLNTIGIVTMQMLMQASKEPTWKQYIEDLDLTVIGETEVLEAAGIDPETPSYEEVETNEFIARFFWGLQNQRKNLAEPWRAFDAAERGRYKNELVGNSAKEEYVQTDGNKI